MLWFQSSLQDHQYLRGRFLLDSGVWKKDCYVMIFLFPFSSKQNKMSYPPPPPTATEDLLSTFPSAQCSEHVKWIVNLSDVFCDLNNNSVVSHECQCDTLTEAECVAQSLEKIISKRKGDIQKTYFRHLFVSVYSFAVPNNDVIKEIVKHSPLVEVGAGAGYWAYLITKFGGEICATDSYEWERGKAVSPIFTYRKMWYDIERLSAEETIAVHPTKTPLLVWPYPNQTWADSVLTTTKSNVAIIVGEVGSAACTADPLLHNKSWKVASTHKIWNWSDINDIVRIVVRTDTN